ncbi:Cathepsin D [Nymphon striatum]|nr:Cathepsin D [Nymphon striatum]
MWLAKNGSYDSGTSLAVGAAISLTDTSGTALAFTPDFLDTSEDGELLIGGINEKLYTGKLTYINLSEPRYWKVPSNGHGHVTNEVIIPSEGMDHGYIPLTVNPWLEVIVVPCDRSKHSAITFLIGDHEFTLNPEDYILGPIVLETEKGQFEEVCIAGFIFTNSTDSENVWAFGNVFLKKYYTVFDFGKKRVGFAEAKQSSDSSNSSDSISSTYKSKYYFLILSIFMAYKVQTLEII